ncbi:protein-export protein SecB [Pelagibacteraceae bacterium GOM-A5]|nr:protein-export protein SecB [Pelagibacteraceae bacterium GOM-A5]|tara:strand:- start:1287 stop:1709 length:423 start_codon:yes stop_codon:yes gene_type:complete
MTKKYEILIKYIKDLSVEIPNAEAFIFSREYITKYSLGINITTKPLKDEMIEIITKINYKDPTENKRKSYFEIQYATVIKLKDKKIKKDELERIILCDVQNEIYPSLEKIFLSVIKDSGFPDLKLEKKVDFEKLYQQRLN